MQIVMNSQAISHLVSLIFTTFGIFISSFVVLHIVYSKVRSYINKQYYSLLLYKHVNRFMNFMLYLLQGTHMLIYFDISFIISL